MASPQDSASANGAWLDVIDDQDKKNTLAEFDISSRQDSAIRQEI
jgi:hypothetical protein